jgi:hypothetical protein
VISTLESIKENGNSDSGSLFLLFFICFVSFMAIGYWTWIPFTLYLAMVSLMYVEDWVVSYINSRANVQDRKFEQLKLETEKLDKEILLHQIYLEKLKLQEFRHEISTEAVKATRT